jgi:hypothetical protein
MTRPLVFDDVSLTPRRYRLRQTKTGEKHMPKTPSFAPRRNHCRQLLTLLVAVGLAGLGTPQLAGAQTAGERRGVDRPRVLSAPKRVRDALPELRGNGKLEEARVASGVTAQQLDDAAKDDTIWMDDRGGLYAIDPAPLAIPPSTPTETGNPNDAPRPYLDTFVLHSRPGSNRVIFLDFDGETLTNTQWNGAPYNLPPGTIATGIDYDGNPTTFSPLERAVIQSTWQRVAEDYAPFDVDVTTQDPGLAAIDRTNAADTQFGTRLVYTNSATVFGAVCASSCGGIANIGGFDDIGADHQFHQPGFAFQDGCGGCNPTQYFTFLSKFFGEVGSHEVGHYMGLFHHGTAALTYYGGQGQWSPIMGDSYSRPVSQWSHGEYTGANNSSQDDLAVISAGGTPLLGDDHGDTTAAATNLVAGVSTTGAGMITTRTDVDVFRVTAPATSGRINVTALPAPTSPNLDIKLDLLDAAGTQIATADPPVGTGAPAFPYDVNLNLQAPLSFAVTPGAAYYLRVDGVGHGAPSNTGYSDFASVGRYNLSVNFVNTGPSGVTATSDAPNAVTVNWTAPGDTTGITYYFVVLTPTAGGGNIYQWVAGAATTTTTIYGPAAKEYTASVYAYTSVLVGGSPPSAPVTVIGPHPAPTGVTAIGGDGQLTVSWTPPVVPGVVISYYRIVVKRNDIVSTSAYYAVGTATSTVITGLGRSQYSVSVEAGTDGGLGLGSDFTAPTPVNSPPGRVGTVTATPISGGITASWIAPTDTGGSPVTYYRIVAANASNSYSVYASAAATTGTVTGIPVGTYTVSVAAGNVVGLGAIANPTGTVTTTVSGSGATALLPAPSNVAAGSNSFGLSVNWNNTLAAGYYLVIARPTNGALGVYSQWVASPITAQVSVALPVHQDSYTVSVVGYSNTTGFGAFSTETTPVVVASAGPDIMAAPTGTGSASTATVSWTAPFNGGQPITYYRIMLTPVGGGPATVVWSLASSTSQVVYTASAGSYTARIQAYSSRGFGPQSPSSAPFTIT